VPKEKEAPGQEDFSPLTEWERKLFQRIASNMGEFSSEFYSAIMKKMAVTVPNISVSALAGIKGEAWREVGAAGQPSFQGTWVNYGATFDTAAFYKDVLGIVHLKGNIKDGTMGALAFVLPDGYKPARDLRFAVESNNAHGSLIIQSDGDVFPNAGSTAIFSLEVSFRAA
jgi:hypothetical protein